MSVATHDLLAAAAIRINALFGTDPVELQVTYSTRPLTNELFQSSIFPMNAVRDSLEQAQGKLARQIAFSDNKVERSRLHGLTAALASGNRVPEFDSNDDPIIGNFGAVLDGADQSIMLTRKPVALVRNRLLSPLLYLAPAYYYALDGARLIHTRSTVILECCVYNSTTQIEAFDSNSNMLLSDDLAEAIICGGCAMLVRDDEFIAQSGRWAEYFMSTLAQFPPAVGEEMAA